MLGESPDSQKERLELATKEAKDLSGLVKKRKRRASDGPSLRASTNLPPNAEKRKVGELEVEGHAEQERAIKRQHK